MAKTLFTGPEAICVPYVGRSKDGTPVEGDSYGSVEGQRCQSIRDAADDTGDVDRDRQDEQHPVAPVGARDRGLRESEAEADILHVAEGLLDREAPTVQPHDIFGVKGVEIGCKAPGVLHSATLHEDYGCEAVAARCDVGLEEAARPTVGRYEVCRATFHTIVTSHEDVLSKTNDEVEGMLSQPLGG